MRGNRSSLYDRVLERVLEESYRLGVPSIEPEDGLALYSMLFVLAAERKRLLVVDAGAGIGYSSLWLLRALEDAHSSGSSLVAVELDSRLAARAEELLRETAPSNINIEVYRGDAIEFFESLEPETIDFAFIDIYKDQYPEALDILSSRLKTKGIAVFHNAFFPKPPEHFFEKARRKPWRSTIVPTRLGLLVAIKE